MRILLMCEIAALFVLPIVLGLMACRGRLDPQRMVLPVAGLLGLFLGTYALYLDQPSAATNLTLGDWLVAVMVGLVVVVVGYAAGRWLLKQWFSE